MDSESTDERRFSAFYKPMKMDMKYEHSDNDTDEDVDICEDSENHEKSPAAKEDNDIKPVKRNIGFSVDSILSMKTKSNESSESLSPRSSSHENRLTPSPTPSDNHHPAYRGLTKHGHPFSVDGLLDKSPQLSPTGQPMYPMVPSAAFLQSAEAARAAQAAAFSSAMSSAMSGHGHPYPWMPAASQSLPSPTSKFQ